MVVVPTAIVPYGRADVLWGIATEAGLESDGVARALTDSGSLEAVTKLEQEGYGLGIQGVPFFILLPGIWMLAYGNICSFVLAAKKRPLSSSLLAGAAAVLTVILDLALIPRSAPSAASRLS